MTGTAQDPNVLPVRLEVVLGVNIADWQDAYGLNREEVEGDVRTWFNNPDMVDDWRERGVFGPMVDVLSHTVTVGPAPAQLPAEVVSLLTEIVENDDGLYGVHAWSSQASAILAAHSEPGRG